MVWKSLTFSSGRTEVRPGAELMGGRVEKERGRMVAPGGTRVKEGLVFFFV